MGSAPAKKSRRSQPTLDRLVKLRNRQNRSPNSSSSTQAEKSKIVNARGPHIAFEKEDWTAFRTVEGLQRRAGTSTDKLASVVVKELVDNALDAAGDCDLKLSDGAIIVTDKGEGIPGDDQEIARIFSMNRPQISSKFLRLPKRGALGNGLRVVIGAVVATGGKLVVSTGGRRLEVIPDAATGKSHVRCIGRASYRGTRIEVTLGDPLVPSPSDLRMGQIAIAAGRSQRGRYKGATSPHWYDVDAFHELAMSVQDHTLTARAFIAGFDGCKRKSGESAAEFQAMPVRTLSRDQAARLLLKAKEVARPVKAERLGSSEPKTFSGAYAKVTTDILLARDRDGSRISIPVVVEAWVDIRPDLDDSILTILVNATPCITSANAWHQEKAKATLICNDGLDFEFKTGRHILVM